MSMLTQPLNLCLFVGFPNRRYRRLSMNVPQDSEILAMMSQKKWWIQTINKKLLNKISHSFTTLLFSLYKNSNVFDDSNKRLWTIPNMGYQVQVARASITKELNTKLFYLCNFTGNSKIIVKTFLAIILETDKHFWGMMQKRRQYKHNFSPNNAEIFEGSFFWGVQFEEVIWYNFTQLLNNFFKVDSKRKSAYSIHNMLRSLVSL